ncbi:MAG: hypothetical protein Q4F71_11620 [Paracoccus sp. (in: a-proteobacteria)]|nr:hypothetical protein [Paracoccus sp. (in: a-proteobacteria)]
MSNPRAATAAQAGYSGPGNVQAASHDNIGDVLASIRELIAQEDGLPDFASPACRADSRGNLRSTAPLGPSAERIRGVIDRELSGLEDAAGPAPLRLAEDAMVSGGKDAAKAATTSLATAPIELPQPEAAAPTQPEAAAMTNHEDDMNITELKPVAELASPDFDLFASETGEDDLPQDGSALRSLVRDVLQSELQGELGARISRNLRRAVRQEVAASISAGLRA